MTDSKLCIWREDEDGDWETECGKKFITRHGTPKNNGFKICPVCGRKLKQKVFKEEK
jgi:rRNA maturation endonuclease Nob1